jgi:hypothetical protein
MVAAAINIGTMLISMTLMTVSARVRRTDHVRAAWLYNVAFRFGVMAALASLAMVGLKLIAVLNDQPVGRLGLLGLVGVLAFKIWVALFARKARNVLGHI